MYYWDGASWVSTVSPDGRFRWNGSAWTPLTGYGPIPQQAPRKLREPTSWTRPLQYAVAGRYVLTGIYAAALPLWMGGVMSQYVQRSIQRQQQAYPPGEGPPPGFNEMMTSIMSGSLWLAAVLAIAISVIAIIGAWKLWAWVYYAVLVLLGIGLISLPYNIIDLTTGRAISGMQGMRLPEWTYVVSLATGVVSAALFAFMLAALIKRGPWGMRRVS
jgi:hypothetical protein